MRILFTKSDKILSKLIRNVTDEPVSHCALEVDLGDGPEVVHSNLYGVHMEPSETFRKGSEVVFSLERIDPGPMVEITDTLRLGRLFMQNDDAGYDFGAFAFLGLSLVARHYLNIPLPKSNLWQSSGMFLCTEWVSAFAAAYKEDNSMITPYKLYLKLKNDGWRDA